MTDEIKNTAGTAKFHPAVVMLSAKEREARENDVEERGAFPILSAYTLALRDPELFSAHYGAAKKPLH